MERSIGIDVSKDTLEVVIYDGTFSKNMQYENNLQGLAKLDDTIRNQGEAETLITMEATGVYHLQAAVYLYEKGYTVSVLNPLKIKRYSEMKMLRAKTDSVDARAIAAYGFHEEPCYFTAQEYKKEHIVQLLQQIDAFQRTELENSNRLHALQRIPGANEQALEIYRELVRMLKEKERKAEHTVYEIVNESYADEYRLLKKIPGVGNRLAALIIGYFGKFENFNNAKQVASFIGLNPSPVQSGISIKGRGAISKKGNRYIRKMFYMAALSASKYNKACNSLYERLLAKGKSKKLALIAVANKLIRQIFAIVKYGSVYDPNYQKNFSYC